MKMSNSVTFNLVVRAETDAHLQELCSKDVDRDWTLFSGGENCWSLQTYLLLKQSGCPVTCSRHLIPNRVNLGHAAYLGVLDPNPDAFVVSLQADFPRVSWAQMHAVQNQSQVRDETMCYIPHWPQPGLIARKASRHSVELVAHAGRAWMLAGSTEEWNSRLERIGCQFRQLGEKDWNDLSEVDVLLAIRSFNTRTYKTKPPTKLLNAWLAGIPLVAGYDCAFSHVGQPGLDYIRVSTMDEAIREILRLKDDPRLYNSMVARGKQRAMEYSRARIAERWMEFLSSRVTSQYEAWVRNGGTNRFVWMWKVARTYVVRSARGKVRALTQRVMGVDRLNRWRLRFR